MASYKGHLIGGILVTIISLLLLRYYFNIVFTWTFLPSVALVVFVYSLMPDIDHKMSKIVWTIFFISALFLINGLLYYGFDIKTYNTLFFGIILVLLPIITIFTTEHRGITHTLLFVLLTPLLLLLIPSLQNKFILMIIAGISYWSHLLLDGIPFKLTFYPKKGWW